MVQLQGFHISALTRAFKCGIAQHKEGGYNLCLWIKFLFILHGKYEPPWQVRKETTGERKKLYNVMHLLGRSSCFLDKDTAFSFFPGPCKLDSWPWTWGFPWGLNSALYLVKMLSLLFLIKNSVLGAPSVFDLFFCSVSVSHPHHPLISCLLVQAIGLRSENRPQMETGQQLNHIYVPRKYQGGPGAEDSVFHSQEQRLSLPGASATPSPLPASLIRPAHLLC